MKLYSQLQPKDANKIIIMANKGLSKYRISKITGASKGVISRCLKSCEMVKIKPNIQKPWEGPKKYKSYSFKIWRNSRDSRKSNRAYKYASEAEVIYLPFVNFCKQLFKTEILEQRVKRSADEFIKEFKKAFPNECCPSRSWVYRMAKSHYYSFNHIWLPHTKQKEFSVKSDHEQLKSTKYNSIEKRDDKEWLRSFPGNFEIDSVIGKRTDKTALLTLMDLHTGKMYIHKYSRTMESFRDSLSEIINFHHLEINTLTMDNGGENNLLWTIIDKSKMFNCHPYCSGEKGTLENAHRIIRRIIPKGKTMDNYSLEDIRVLNGFVNNYYSKKFNRI